jgi:hypothetical protein
MRRFRIALVSVAATFGALTPVAAQAAAGPAGTDPAAAMNARASASISRAITLPAGACAKLRHSRHDSSITCEGHMTIRVTRVNRVHHSGSLTASTYWKGYATACGGAFGGPCRSWWVDIHAAFTTSGTQTWNNSSACTAGGTNLTGCGFHNNGTGGYFVEADFSSGGWLMFIVPDGAGYSAYQAAVSWANLGGFCSRPGNGCYS